MASSRIGVVFVHGLFSSPKTWDTIAGLLTRDESMLSVSAQRFHYASPKFRLRPDRRIPDFNDLADQLKSFLSTRAKEYDRLVLVAHSQGGLVVQRYLSRLIAQGKGQELARIGGVVLFACPNDGSSFALSLRTSWLRRNPQEGELRTGSLDRAPTTTPSVTTVTCTSHESTISPLLAVPAHPHVSGGSEPAAS